jgi:hypothetical protein
MRHGYIFRGGTIMKQKIQVGTQVHNFYINSFYQFAFLCLHTTLTEINFTNEGIDQHHSIPKEGV